MFLTPGAATLAVVGAFVLGVGGARWRAAERERVAAGGRQRAAGKAVWRARRIVLGAAAFAFALGYVWVHKH